MKKRLSAKRKSELCLICGKCCMSMTFFGGEVDDESRDEIHWMELHGLKIEYQQKRGHTEYYFTIPKRCDALQEVQSASGETNYICGVYETRPQMCRDYDGRMEGPFGVADCLWRLESAGASHADETPALPGVKTTQLVQLQPLTQTRA